MAAGMLPICPTAVRCGFCLLFFFFDNLLFYSRLPSRNQRQAAVAACFLIGSALSYSTFPKPPMRCGYETSWHHSLLPSDMFFAKVCDSDFTV